ncbi:UNVERIFIED_CONTAM: hypothetical protein H355_014536 [Colinus virginianus]|nr:hypothetical protein H355_014536 [Colinus virginianus]
MMTSSATLARKANSAKKVVHVFIVSKSGCGTARVPDKLELGKEGEVEEGGRTGSRVKAKVTPTSSPDQS